MVGSARCLSSTTYPPGAGSQGVAIYCGRVKGHGGPHQLFLEWKSTTRPRMVDEPEPIALLGDI